MIDALRKIGPPLVIIAAGVAVYAGSFRVPFIFDDYDAIVNNPNIRALWPLATAMTPPQQSTLSSRPVVSLSLAVNYAVSGLNVWSYHAFNLLVHLLNGLLLFAIARRTLSCPRLAGRFGQSGVWIAFAAALLWTVHPLQTETVVYVVQRTELLVAFFMLLTLYLCIRASASVRPIVWQAAAVVACGLGMGSKEIMVSTPLLVLLYDRAFVSRSFAETFRKRRGFLIALAATWVILILAIAASSRSRSAGFAAGQMENITPLIYLCTQAGVITHYLRLCFWPHPLSITYGWPIAESLSDALPAGLLIVGLLGLGAWLLWRRPGLGFLAAGFFLILAPTSSFIPIVTEIVAERRMYLPLASVVFVVVLAVSALLERIPRAAWRRAAVGGLLGVATIAAAGGSAARVGDYRTEESIWRNAAEQYPLHNDALAGLGNALARQSRFAEAIPYLEKAVEVFPRDMLSHRNLGWAYGRVGRLEKAVEHLTFAIEGRGEIRGIDDSDFARSNLAVALISLGQHEEALPHLKRALELNPDSFVANANLAWLLATRGTLTPARAAEAVRRGRQACELTSYGNARVVDILAAAYAAAGRFEAAIQSAEMARELASSTDNADLEREVRARLDLYRAGKPYREGP